MALLWRINTCIYFSSLKMVGNIPACCKQAYKMGRTKRFISFFLLLFALVMAAPQLLMADYLDDWKVRNNLPTAEMLRGITYGNSTYVAVGINGVIITSPDGETWTERESYTDKNLYNIIYENSTFVAVGEKGTILTSPDGKIWTKRKSKTKKSLVDITYGNSLFVVVGVDGIIRTSPDGIKWKKIHSGLKYGLHGITYGNATFVAITSGKSGSFSKFLFCSDCSTWT